MAYDAHFPIHHCKPGVWLSAQVTGQRNRARGNWLLQHPEAEVGSTTPFCASAVERGLEKDHGQSPLAPHKESGGWCQHSGSAVVWLSSQMRAWSLGFFLVNGLATRRKQITRSHCFIFYSLSLEELHMSSWFSH